MILIKSKQTVNDVYLTLNVVCFYSTKCNEIERVHYIHSGHFYLQVAPQMNCVSCFCFPDYFLRRWGTKSSAFKIQKVKSMKAWKVKSMYKASKLYYSSSSCERLDFKFVPHLVCCLFFQKLCKCSHYFNIIFFFSL